MSGVQNRLLQASLLLVLVAPLAARAETVIRKVRIGNNTEGITFAPSGLWKDHVIAIDGNDVLSIATAGAVGQGDPNGSKNLRGTGWKKIFDTLAVGAREPRGIVYQPDLQQFWFSSPYPADASQFFRTDASGNPLPPIALTGLGDVSNFTDWEGLAWIPLTAPHHPGTVVGVANRTRASDGALVAQLTFINLDGTVEGIVDPQLGTPLESYLCGIQYEPAHGRLLATDCAESVHAVGFDGSFQGTVITQAGAGDIEGIAVDRSGRLWVSNYAKGHLYAFDAAYAPNPANDRFFTIGLGVSVARMTFNWDTGELLVRQNGSAQIAGVSQNLNAVRVAGSYEPSRVPVPTGLAYLGGGVLAIGDRNSPTKGVELLSLPTGELNRLVTIFGTGFPGGGIDGVGTIGVNRFAWVRAATPSLVYTLTRDGAPDDTRLPGAQLPTRGADFPLSAPMTSYDFQAFDDGVTGTHYFTGAEIYDASGTLTRRIDQAALGITEGKLTSGAHLTGNTFAGIHGQTSTVVIYSVP